MLFPKSEPRRFTFTPYLYNKEEEEETEDRPRIKFKRIVRNTRTGEKSLVRMIILAVLLIFFLFYFHEMVKEDQKKFKIEDIRIEEAIE